MFGNEFFFLLRISILVFDFSHAVLTGERGCICENTLISEITGSNHQINPRNRSLESFFATAKNRESVKSGNEGTACLILVFASWSDSNFLWFYWHNDKIRGGRLHQNWSSVFGLCFMTMFHDSISWEMLMNEGECAENNCKSNSFSVMIFDRTCSPTISEGWEGGGGWLTLRGKSKLR